MSRDMMSAFELYQPDTVEGAVDLLGRFGEEGWALAGGNDSFDWFKDRVKRPKYVVDLGGIAALKGIRDAADGGVEIGALTTLTEVERNSVIQNRFKVLSDAIRKSCRTFELFYIAKSVVDHSDDAIPTIVDEEEEVVKMADFRKRRHRLADAAAAAVEVISAVGQRLVGDVRQPAESVGP